MIPNASRNRTYAAVNQSDDPTTSLQLNSNGSPSQGYRPLMGGDEGGGGDASLQAVSTFAKKIEPILEQDRFLPIANIARIMKKVIPVEGKLSKESKECMQECVTEFILFITSEASERCSIERRKTITGEDLVQAFSTLGFDDYVEPLRDFLRKYREANKIHGSKTDELPTTGLDNLGSTNLCTLTPRSTSSQNLHRLDDSDLSPALKRRRNLHSAGEDQPVSAKCTVPSTAAAEGSSQTLPPTLQSMPMFVDVATNQYYITVQGPDGTQSLLPVTLSTATNNSNSSREGGMDGGAQVARSMPGRGHVEDGEQTVRHYLQSKNATRSKKMGS